MYNQNQNQDFELGLTNNSFKDKLNDISLQMRLGFVKKVYGILSVQLLITVLFCALSMTNTTFYKFQAQSSILFIFCLILTIALPCVIVCFQSTMRTVPYNYYILFAFTLAESYIVSYICGRTNPRFVFMAAFMTFSLVVALTVYAATTQTDFTMQGGLIFVLGCGVMMLTIFGLFTNNKIFHIIICSVSIVLFGLYLLYDTQLILGGKENALETDDYILGAFMLYTDIIYLFLRLLELIQLFNSQD
jgi:FtsH-binding integral membrane protein